jgi:sigma-E factor negative regulatory protein RseB
MLEQMFFTEVEFPQRIPDSAFDTQLDPARMRQVTENAAGAISAAADDVAATQNDRTEAGASPDKLEFGQLPPGFRVTMRDVRVLPDNRGAVEHVLLSDGLTAISIFRSRQRTPAPPGAVRDGVSVSQMGAMQAYGRSVGRMQITVVGEAPRETLRMIAESLKAEPDAPVPSAAAPPP